MKHPFFESKLDSLFAASTVYEGFWAEQMCEVADHSMQLAKSHMCHVGYDAASLIDFPSPDGKLLHKISLGNMPCQTCIATTARCPGLSSNVTHCLD